MAKKVYGIIAFGNQKEFFGKLYKELGFNMVLYRFYEVNNHQDLKLCLTNDSFDNLIIVFDSKYSQLIDNIIEFYKDKNIFVFQKYNSKPTFKYCIFYVDLVKDVLSFLSLNNSSGLISIDENDINGVLKNKVGHIVSFKNKNYNSSFLKTFIKIKHPSFAINKAKNAIVCFSLFNNHIYLSKIWSFLEMIKGLNEGINIIFGLTENIKTNEIIILSA